MFIFLDKQRESLSQWLKKKTTMDFSDWGIFVFFFAGLFPIFYFSKDRELADIIPIIVLWFTAIVVMQYTKETHFLKNITRKQYDLDRAPFVIINYEDDHPKHGKVFYLKNLGNGIARNVKIKPITHPVLGTLNMGRDSITFPVKTVIATHSGHTFIKPIITDDMLRKRPDKEKIFY